MSTYPLPVPFPQTRHPPAETLGTHHGHSLGLQELGGCHHSEVGHVHEDVAPCHQRDPDDDGQGQVSGRGRDPGTQSDQSILLETHKIVVFV